METIMNELIATRWNSTPNTQKDCPRVMYGKSWWKMCGYGTECNEAYEAGFKKGYTPYSMKHYKYLDFEDYTSGFDIKVEVDPWDLLIERRKPGMYSYAVD